MKDLMGVILNNQKSTEYRVKFAFEPSSEQLTDIKRIFDKYDCKTISKPQRTIFQSKPVDFYSLDCGEIWIIEVDLLRGIQPDIVKDELSKVLRVSDAYIVVGLKDIPHSTYELDNEIDFDDYIPKTLDTNYADAHAVPDDLYGDKLLDKVIKAANEDYSKDRTPYSEYMIAGYEGMIPAQAKSDVKESRPNKE